MPNNTFTSDAMSKAENYIKISHATGQPAELVALAELSVKVDQLLGYLASINVELGRITTNNYTTKP